MVFTADIIVGRARGVARGIVLQRSPSSPAPAESSALVSGAGSAEANGTYTPRGTNAGRAYYNLVGQPDDPLASSVYWDGGGWLITLSDTSSAYGNSGEDVADPWDSAAWFEVDGESPAPTVTDAGDVMDVESFITENAVAYYPMSDTSDATGRGNDLTNNNAATFAAGHVGNALGLASSSSQYLSRTSTTDLQIGPGDFIVATWVKFASVDNSRYPLSKPGEYGIYLSLGDLYFGAGDGAGEVESSVTPSTDVWYLLVCWYDRANGVFHLRVNDGAADSAPQEDAVGTGGGFDFNVGSGDGTGSFFDGQIDDTLIIKSATSLSSGDFDSLGDYLWNDGDGRDLSGLFP